MVLIGKITMLLPLIFYSANLFSNELNDDEKMYFNFIDFNNDNQISFLEIEKSINLIFQIVDLNHDGFISQSELSELKNIVDSFK